jgi:prevent-host-death family protein
MASELSLNPVANMPRPTKLPSEESVGFSVAKARLSSLTKKAKAGTRIIITNHGTPVADLVAHGAGTTLRFKRPGRLPKPFRLKGKGPTLSELLLTDRVG